MLRLLALLFFQPIEADTLTLHAYLGHGRINRVVAIRSEYDHKDLRYKFENIADLNGWMSEKSYSLIDAKQLIKNCLPVMSMRYQDDDD
jgi:hypothetical protein